MTGILVLIAFELAGTAQAYALCRRREPIIRIWLGLTAGLVEMMWLPSLYAFIFDFTLTAQNLALATALLAAVVCVVFGMRRGKTDGAEQKLPLLPLVCLLVPIAALTGYLQFTHTLREVDGALHCGQSTYGDLCMHLSFAAGLVGQSYAPQYTLLPGATLGYPFLVDALSSTMLIYGTPLSLSFIIPGTLMTVYVFAGLYFLTWEITRRRAASVLAVVLLLFSGGLGFIGTLDLSGLNNFAGLKNALHGYYQAPANLPDSNLVWVNALCDLLIPQRTLMAGWTCVLPALYLLYTGMKSGRTSDFAALGLWAGPMVMIHTHSFLALGMISLGAMVYTLLRGEQDRKRSLLNFGVYGVLACILAFPQLLKWTFPQTVDGGSLRLMFNWMNNNDGSLKDGYLWFWVKNAGPVFLFLLPAALSTKDKPLKALMWGSLALFLLAEFVLFQPNVYDNNKLFYVSYICALPCAAGLLVNVYDRLKGIRGRALLAAAFLFVCTASGAISIARECVSDYELFSPAQAEAAEYLKENTPTDAMVLTSNNHNNAAASLAGRRIVCGSALYLYYHGLSYQRQEADAALMLQYPEELENLYEQYGIDYVYVSSYERAGQSVWNGYVPDASMIRGSYAADEHALSRMYPLVYEGEDTFDRIRIYAVSERAKAWAEEDR